MAEPRRIMRVVRTTAPLSTLSIHPHTQCPTGASEGKHVVRWCLVVLPPCGHVVICETDLSDTYIDKFPL
jgi:hypothetical protein